MSRSAWREIAGKIARQWARSRTGVPVLLYHYIGPLEEGIFTGGSVSPGKFGRQVEWLSRRGYNAVCPSDWLAWQREGKPLPSKPVLITFDDAYADIAHYALPVLRRFGFRATVFVITGLIGETNMWDQRMGYRVLDIMNLEQIQEWAAQGIEFGAHTRTHPDLTTLTSHQLIDEVVGSGTDLSRILGTEVLSFAYPYGHYNTAVLECAKKAFPFCFTTRWGLNERSAEPHLLRRMEVRTGHSLADLRCQLRWGLTIGQLAGCIYANGAKIWN